MVISLRRVVVAMIHSSCKVSGASAIGKKKKHSQDADYQHVTLAEYCNLLVSRKQLDRCDEGQTNLAGLRDRQTGARYMIEASLFYSEHAVR